MKKKTKPKSKAKVKRKSKNQDTSHLRKSKGEDFLKKFKEDNSMVDYFTRLRILNPAAEREKSLNIPRREGGFVRLAHAREEFSAPVLNKGKYFNSKNKKKKDENPEEK